MAQKKAFISYRRDEWAKARVISIKLQNKSVDTFLDVDKLKQSYFDEQLFRYIDEYPNFILILTPGALDRCKSENDWVRKEIAYAILKGKNIVPVRDDKFVFPEIDDLPSDINTICKYHSVKLDHDSLDYWIDRLIEFLVPDRDDTANPLNGMNDGVDISLSTAPAITPTHVGQQTDETTEDVLKGIGGQYLRAIASKLNPSRLPIKPLAVETGKALDKGLYASWQVTDQDFLAIMLRTTRTNKVDVRWGIYSKNKTQAPLLRQACRQFAKSHGASENDGIVSISGSKYRLESIEDYLGYQTNVRILPSELAKSEVVKLHAEQLIAFVEKIWPVFQKYLIGGLFLKAVLSGVDASMLPFAVRDMSTHKDIVENLEVTWHVTKRHYFSVRLSDALKVQWGLYSENTKRDRPFNDILTELQQIPGLIDNKGDLVISGARYRYKKTSRYHGIVASEPKSASELRDSEFIKTFSGQLREFMNMTWPVVQKHLVSPKP